MTFEARLFFVLLFFAIWCFLGFLPWTFAAVIRRGRDVLPALPIALLCAAVAGVLVPVAGARDSTGFLVSLATAGAAGVLGTIGGIALTVRLSRATAPPEAGDGD